MKNHHVELIDPREKITRDSGGTGYVGPKEPARVIDLYVNALWSAEKWPELNSAVWKVLIASADWHRRWSKTRRLRIEGRTIPCTVLGSTREWWFVSVDATKAATILCP